MAHPATYTEKAPFPAAIWWARIRRRLPWLTPIFLITVAIPTLCAVLYFGFIAGDVYVSESRFVVRSAERPSAATSGLGALISGAGFTGAQEDTFTVPDYIQSRDALRLLDATFQLGNNYAHGGVDVFNRFGTVLRGESFEDLYKYYTRKIVTVQHDATSSITTLEVRAPTAEQATQYNTKLLELSEALVNRLNERARNDLVRFARTEVADAQKKAQAAALAVATYRNDKQVLDPERQAGLQLQQVLKLQETLLEAKTQLAQLQTFTPQNPQIPAARKRVQVIQETIDSETGKATGGNASLARKAADYQRLQLEKEFTDKQLGVVLTAYEQARTQAQRQQLYLERIVEPNLPDVAIEPKRLRSIFATLAIGLVAWGVLSLLVSGIREHHD